MDGLTGDDTVYFSEAGATYHLDSINANAFEDLRLRNAGAAFRC